MKITLVHSKEKEPKDVTIVRDTIQVKSVTSWLKQFDCKGGTCVPTANCPSCVSAAYIRISQFGDKTNEEWLSAVNKLLPERSKSKVILKG